MPKNQIYLISPYPESQLWKKKKSIFKLPPFPLFLIKGITPLRYEIKIIDESQEDIDLDSINDSIVCLSIMTSNANRGYEIASRLRERNIIIFGGIHASSLPLESLEYGHSVCIGEIENIWIGLLNDLEKGRLKKVYRSRNRPKPEDIPGVSYIKGDYIVPNLIAITRGCPYNCDFCSVSKFFGSKYRKRPVSSAFFDFGLRNFGMFILLDDNLTIDKSYFLFLFDLISSLNINWVGQSSIGVLNDEEILDKLRASGCSALLIGFESSSEKDRKNFIKHRSNEKMENIIKKIKSYKILIHGSFIFGLDEDTDSKFSDTLNFCNENRIDTANFSILVPYPNTGLYRKFYEEGRLYNFKDWDTFDRSTLTFNTKNIDSAKIRENILDLYIRFYSLFKIILKTPFHSPYRLLFYLSYSLYYRKGVKKLKIMFDDCTKRKKL